MAAKSYRIGRINVLLEGQTEPLDQVEIDRVPSPHPHPLYTGQDVIEETLSATGTAKGGAVERGKKVVAVETDDEGVTVTVIRSSDADNPNAPSERLRCRYLVGADGVKGTVRKSVGLEFETEPFEGRATRQMDAKLRWRRSTNPDQLWFFLYHNGFAGIMPVWGGYHRLFFLEDDAAMPERDPTLEEIQDRAREITGDDTLTLADPVWASYARFKHGVAPAYSSGRVYLAGDAGHHTLPIGGQGMNAGLNDAIGLAWRLAMTLAGQASAVVLDSYDAERRNAHAELDADQAKGFRRLEYRSRIGDAARHFAARILPNLGSKVFGRDDLQQLAVGYPKSPLSEDDFGLKQVFRSKAPHAGDRAPDAEVTRDGRTTSLFAQVYNPDGRTWGWCLLAFDGRRSDAGPLLLAAAAEVARWDWVRPRLILAGPIIPEIAAGVLPVLSDLDGHAHSAYALEGIPALILIRPDGHIAFRGLADRPDLLREYCSNISGLA